MMWKLWITSRRFAIMNIPYCSFYTVLMSSCMIPQNKTFNSEDITSYMRVVTHLWSLVPHCCCHWGNFNILIPLHWSSTYTLLFYRLMKKRKIKRKWSWWIQVSILPLTKSWLLNTLRWTFYSLFNSLPAINDYLVYNFFLNCTYDV